MKTLKAMVLLPKAIKKLQRNVKEGDREIGRSMH